MTCPECGAPVLPMDRGENVCSGCDLVVEANMIDTNPSTTWGDNGPTADGRGPALSVQNPVTMTTRPVITSRDASGRTLSPSSAAKYEYLNTIDSRVISKRDRSSRRLFESVHDLALRLQLSQDVEDRAFRVAQKTVSARALKGWEFSLVAGSAVFFALFERDGYLVPDRLVEMVDATHPSEREKNLRKGFKEMERVMGSRLPRATAIQVARDVAARMGLPPEVLSTLRRHEPSVPSASPLTDAAAMIYLAARELGLGTSQREIAEACGTTDVSMRKRLDGVGSNTLAVMGD